MKWCRVRARAPLGAATSVHPDTDLACASIRMATTARGGKDAIWREEEAELVTLAQARAVVIDWAYGFYNHQRRHSAAGMMSPVAYEQTTAAPQDLHDPGNHMPHEHRRCGHPS